MRRSTAALFAGVVLGFGVGFASTAQAQSVWGGPGSTTTTPDYNLNTNWAPSTSPVAAGQSAVFGATGSSSVSVTAGPIAPDSWTFNANSQSYTITGAAVNFSTATGLVNNANAGQAISVANNLGGAGAVTQNGNSMLTLSGVNAYAGGTTITTGTLVAAHQSAGAIDALGGGDITMNGGALRSTVTGTFNNNLTFNTGTSSVVSAAAGQAVTFGPNGGTSVVTFADNSTATFGSVTDTGTVVISSSTNTVSASAQIVVAGGTLKDGNGVLGNATGFIQSTTVNAGATLDMNDQTDAIHILLGAGTVITGTNPATTLFLLSGDQTTGNFSSHLFSGVIEGPGGVEVGPVGPGGGETILTGTNTYTGGTVIQDGTILQLGNGGASGSILGNVAFTTPNSLPLGQLIFNRSDTYQFDGAISGPGSVTQAGTGMTILTAANSYSGGTTISAGTLIAAHQTAAAIDALGTGDVTMNGGTLKFSVDGSLANNVTFNASTASTVSAGSQNVTLNGVVTVNANAVAQFGIAGDTGTLVLTGGGTADPTAAIVIAGGTVQDGGNASITSLTSSAASTTVNTGATLDFNDSFNQAIHNLSGGGSVKTGSAVSGVELDLFVDAGTSSTFSGVISGSHAVVVQTTGGPGIGTTIFTGANTYTGGTTICSCAALELGNGIHAGSIVGDVTNFGVFNIVNANTSGITSITNDQEFPFATPGLTTFLNATSASTIAITNQNGGETDFGIASGTDTATAGNATIVNRLGGLTVFNAMTTAGNASITNRFGGETDFFDLSDAGTATIVNRFAGLTTFNNFASAMSASITNRFGGETDFFDRSSAGNASITNRFGGSTFFFDHSSAGNATIVNGSFGSFLSLAPVGLGFFDHSDAGTATIINNNHGLIAFGVPFGFDDASAANAKITNNAGSGLEFNAFTTAGNATITTLSGGAVAFFDASTGGNAQFITNGTGYVDFSASVGPGFDGRITAGSIAGSGTYYIGAGNTLIVGSNNLSTEVSGVIADFLCGCAPGPGALTKVGTGNLILSGINTYTGPTEIDGGILSVNGSIASSVLTTVNAGGTLGGNGIVGNTFINGGTLAPGNSVGLLTVHGSLVFTAASSYLVEVSGATADRTNVTGTATPGGATVNAIVLSNTVAKQYTILNATGGVSGTFNPVVNTNVPNLKASLSYDLNNVFLNFALNFGGGLNVNQQNVANALNNFFSANGSIPLVFGTLTPAGLSQASGELATGTQQATFDAMNIFLGLLTDPFVAGRSGGASTGGGAQPYAEENQGSLAYAAKKQNAARDAFGKIPTKADAARNDPFDQRWSVWGSAYGGGSTTDGNAALGSNSATARTFGLVAGADYRISPATLAGFAVAGGGTNFSVSGFGTGRSDLFQAGAFVRHTVGAAYISGALAYGWQDVTTDRTVTIAGIDRLHAEFNANAWSGRVEGGYRIMTPWMGVTPYAAGQFTTYSLPAYAEQVLSGAGTFALNYAAKDVTASRTELGIRTDRSFAMANAILTLRGRFAWAHDFNTDRDITAVFQTLPGAAFVVNGAAQAHDSALVTASAEMKWLNGWSAAATFEGQFSDITRSYAGKGVVRYAW